MLPMLYKAIGHQKKKKKRSERKKEPRYHNTPKPNAKRIDLEPKPQQSRIQTPMCIICISPVLPIICVYMYK